MLFNAGFVAILMVAIVALIHAYIVYGEMFDWPRFGARLMPGKSAEFVEDTRVLAGNQGLYNGFLAAGLLWSLVIPNPDWSRYVATCFLLFVAVAGAYGAQTASRRILYVQTVPAGLALLAVWLT